MKKKNKPESEMMGFAYDPQLSEGSAKVPLFQTSTFVFKNAEEGKAHFHIAYGLREKAENESMSLAYSRINNPNLEIAEDRLKLWDKSEGCALFQSGMAAITTTILELTRPNTLILHSSPLYGGTDHFIEEVLPKYNIKSMYFDSMKSLKSIIEKKNFGVESFLEVGPGKVLQGLNKRIDRSLNSSGVDSLEQIQTLYV